MSTEPRAALALVAALAVGAPPQAGAEPGGGAQADADAAARGAYLFAVAGCGSCHLPPGVDDGPPSGGRPIHTAFGTFYGTNLTPGGAFGAFTEADLRRALREGRAPDGRAYWPVFPYGAYTGLTDGDIGDLYAWLRTQPAVEAPDQPAERVGLARLPVAVPVWRALSFDEGPWTPDPSRDAAWNRGAYLVNAAGHCGECHSPRTRLGGIKEDAALSGAPYHDGLAPNLTPDPATGLAHWTASDWDAFLTTGITADGDVMGGEMADIVRRGTSRLTEADRAAVITYLMALPPIPGRGGGPPQDAPEGGEEDLW